MLEPQCLHFQHSHWMDCLYGPLATETHKMELAISI